MPNLDAAVALIPDVSPSDSAGESPALGANHPSHGGEPDSPAESGGEAVPSEPKEPTSEPPQAPTPDTAAVRRAAMQAIIDKTTEQTRSMREQRAAKAIRANAKRDADEAAGIKAKWQQTLDKRDVVAAFKELNVDPEEAYRTLTKHILDSDTPEERQAKQFAEARAQWMKELEPQLQAAKEAKELAEELKKARQEEAAQGAVREFQALLDRPEYEDLRDWYDPDVLINMGNNYAERLGQQGKSFGLKDVADGLLKMTQDLMKRRDERRAQRSVPTESVAGQTAKESAGSGPKEQTPRLGTISNELAAASGSSSTRPQTREERRRKAAALL